MSTAVTSSVQRITVALERNPYEVVIGSSSLQLIGTELVESGFKAGTKVLVVSNADVAGPYADQCLNSLIDKGFEPTLLVIEAGEDLKTPASIALIHDAAYQARLERGSLMLALGGGVVGDMTGFAAATWLRGISVAQIPTTLLAMVDASIGGKTGVNHPKGKNLIGAFHQPKIVVIDPNTLQTLPVREFKAGMAEVIKYGVIGNIELFKMLEETETISSAKSLSDTVITRILEYSAAEKAKIVAEDEREGGKRAILNYGHTFGHVVENLCGYGTWLHGEAVAIGMVAAGELALIRKSWKHADHDRQRALIKKAGLPVQWPELDPESVINSLKGDKKVIDGKIRFVLPTGIGHVEIRNDVNEEEIRFCLALLRQKALQEN